MLTIGLVVMVIFLFLRSLRATIIPSVAVPLSLVGTFAAMYLLGHLLDNLSLMALTISTGFVVYDAIVMIENISRFLEEGMPPLEAALTGAAASVVRGAAVGLGVGLAGLWFAPIPLLHPMWMLAFAVLGCGALGAAGIVSSLWADDYDKMAAVQNFIIVPLTFLSGVFYSIHSLPPFWLGVSRFNPFFYLIDGFRFGFFGVSDVPPETGLAVVGACFLALSWATLLLLKSGYKLRK